MGSDTNNLYCTTDLLALLWLANCLTALSKYISSNLQHRWHKCVVPSLHFKRIQLLQQIYWCKSFRSPYFCLIGNRKQVILDHIRCRLKMTILTCDLENRLSKSRLNVQNSVTFTLNNGDTYNTWRSKLQQCIVYESGHIQWVIGGKLALITNKTSYMSFQYIGTKIGDLEWLWTA